jgi:hypothetical protein
MNFSHTTLSTAICFTLAAFQFRDLLHSLYDSLDGDHLLHTQETQTKNKRTQTSLPQVGFETTVPVFERAKTVHVLEGGATVIGSHTSGKVIFLH